MSRILPPIFLLVAAFLVNMTLSRLIALEREQIGLLKAIGYSSLCDGAALHASFVTLIAAIGIVIGVRRRHLARRGHDDGSMRSSSLSRSSSSAATRLSMRSRRWSPYAAAVRGAIKAVREGGVPASGGRHVAARPAALPPAARRRVDSLASSAQSQVMVARHLLRWPLRTASSVLGIAFAVAILVGSLWSFGSIDHMIDITFIRTDRQDATINFTEAKPLPALFPMARGFPG